MLSTAVKLAVYGPWLGQYGNPLKGPAVLVAVDGRAIWVSMEKEIVRVQRSSETSLESSQDHPRIKKTVELKYCKKSVFFWEDSQEILEPDY